jgi:hypothetical protein
MLSFNDAFAKLNESDAPGRAMTFNDARGRGKKPLSTFASTNQSGETNMATSKAEIHKLISELSEKHREDGQSPSQAYAEFIKRHPDGQKLYQCYRLADGPSYVPPAPVEVRKVAEGPALRELNELAVELAKRENISVPQAFAAIYADSCPPARALAARERHERYAAMGIRA